MTQLTGVRQLTGAQALVQILQEEGVDVIFGIPGGAVLPFYDALYDAPIRHVLMRHEQGAALAADGYARATGRVGVCVATSGPGATNLVTGLATAMMDSVPVVAITGNVPTHLLGTDAFQETDIFGVTQPITKHNVLVRSADELVRAVRQAFAIARSGRPGPVLVDIPKDVFNQPVRADLRAVPPPRGLRPTPPPDPEAVERAAAAIARARRPVVYAGGGVVTANAAAELLALVDRANLPVTTTLMALGAVPYDHPLFLGLPGMHGTYAANMALTYTDCLIAVGCRFDDRVTGRVSDFAPEATIIHIDIDASEIGKIRPAHVAITTDARQGLAALLAAVDERPVDDWCRQLWRWRAEHPLRDPQVGTRTSPEVVRAIWRATRGDALIATGVGQHQMWVAMTYGFRRPRQLLTSGGLGTMGYGLPAAIGAQVGRPDQQVVLIDGDGSFQMTMAELATVAELELPVKIFVFNNHSHGMVRQWQEMFFSRRYSASLFTRNPDFVRLAEAYGLAAMRIAPEDPLDEAVERALAVDGPVVVDVVVPREENVLPIVPPGAALKEMIEP